MNEQTNTYAFGFHEHALISKMVRRMKNMISPTHSSNSTDTPGCDDFIDYDPLAYYHNMMELDVDVDDNLDSEDLFINLDCLETSSETPASLTRDTSYTPGNASTVSNGSNDDVSNSIGPSNKPHSYCIQLSPMRRPTKPSTGYHAGSDLLSLTRKNSRRMFYPYILAQEEQGPPLRQSSRVLLGG